MGQYSGAWEVGEVLDLRTFTVYEDFCAISVRSHQYGLIVYLFVRQAGLAVDDFQKLRGRVSQ